MAVVPAPQRIDPGELRRLLDQIVAAGAPGAAALVRDEHGVQQAASGLADLRTGRPMRPGLNYRVASVTKPFVATVVLQLVAEGRLSLSDTVERWLPGILPYGGQVSIRQLLNNTSGVPEYLLVPLLELYASKQGRFRSWTPRELVALVAGQSPLFPPGASYSYSNTNYVLAGLIVEAATGKTLGQELKRRIIGPLGLRDTFFPVNRPDIPGRNARGYSLPLGDQGPVLDGPLLDFTVYNPTLAWAAGNLVSDLADLQRFFRALLGGRLLPPRLLTEMTTTVPIGQGAGYGLGLLVLERPCGRLIGHDGGIPGFITIVLSTQDGRRQFGIMVNEFFTTPAVDQAYGQVVVQIAMRLLEGGPCDPAASSASLGTRSLLGNRHAPNRHWPGLGRLLDFQRRRIRTPNFAPYGRDQPGKTPVRTAVGRYLLAPRRSPAGELPQDAVSRYDQHEPRWRRASVRAHNFAPTVAVELRRPRFAER